MGGDMVFGSIDDPLALSNSTDMAGAEERVAHVAECLPEICTLDCGTMNFAEAELCYDKYAWNVNSNGKNDD